VFDDARAQLQRLGHAGRFEEVHAQAARHHTEGWRAAAQVVAGLSAVDRVVLFDDDTPLALIESLVPDVLVKGGDYTRDTIVGADFVESRGGAVYAIPLLPDQSTTAIVERLRVSS